MTLPVCASTAMGGWVGRLRHLKIQTASPALQSLSSSGFAKAPGVRSALASASDLSGRPPHLSWPSAMSTKHVLARLAALIAARSLAICDRAEPVRRRVMPAESALAFHHVICSSNSLRSSAYARCCSYFDPGAWRKGFGTGRPDKHNRVKRLAIRPDSPRSRA